MTRSGSVGKGRKSQPPSGPCDQGGVSAPGLLCAVVAIKGCKCISLTVFPLVRGKKVVILSLDREGLHAPVC